MISTGATLALCLHESIEASHGMQGVESLRFLVESGPTIDEIQCSWSSRTPNQSIAAEYMEGKPPLGRV
jgi:hypothetical protein